MKDSPNSASIIIPARNAESTLPQVLAPLLPLPENWEILVIDDHSTDRTSAIAQSMGVRVISSAGYRSVLAARNTGVALASGEVLIFIDADVVTRIGDLRQSLSRLPKDDHSCLFAVYNRGDHLLNTVSRYKNFWIRHSTLAAPQPLQWLNSSLILIRRTLFLKAGGFLGNFSCSHGGEDLDLGRRIVETGGTILLDRHLEITHLKHFTLGSLWLNDLKRAQGWLDHALTLKSPLAVIGNPSLANVSSRFSWSIITTTLAVLLMFLSPLWTPLAWLSPLLLLLSLLLNGSFLRDAFREKIRGALFFIPLLWFDLMACATGICYQIFTLTFKGRTKTTSCSTQDKG